MSDNQKEITHFADMVLALTDVEWVKGSISRVDFRKVLQRTAWDVAHHSVARLLFTKRIKELSHGHATSTARGMMFFHALGPRGEAVIYLKALPRGEVILQWVGYNYTTDATTEYTTDQLIDYLETTSRTLFERYFELHRTVHYALQEVLKDYEERIATLTRVTGQLDRRMDLTIFISNPTMSRILNHSE